MLGTIVNTLAVLAGSILGLLLTAVTKKFGMKVSERFSERELLKTKIGSRVVCPDKNLLYEEAPEAYKNIVQVIEDMREFGLIRIIARFRPVLHCKP